MSTSSTKTTRSAVTISRWRPGILPDPRCLRSLDHVVNSAGHVEVLLGDIVHVAVENLAEASDCLAQRHEYPGPSREHFGHEHRLGQEPLNLSRARNSQFVFVTQLFDAKNGDNILEVLVSLQYSLHAARHVIMLLADDDGVQNSRTGRQWIDGGKQTQLDDRTVQGHNSVQVAERRRDRGVCVVVGWYVDRLN